MPLLQKESVRLRSRGSELVIQIANQRRVISLPTAMVGYQVIKAEYQDASLIVTFGKGEG
jgi:arsenite-transporting ATPase